VVVCVSLCSFTLRFCPGTDLLKGGATQRFEAKQSRMLRRPRCEAALAEKIFIVEA